MKVGFVVLTYNRSDALLAVLRGLAPQCGADTVVVIADDGSRPEHVQALSAACRPSPARCAMSGIRTLVSPPRARATWARAMRRPTTWSSWTATACPGGVLPIITCAWRRLAISSTAAACC